MADPNRTYEVNLHDLHELLSRCYQATEAYTEAAGAFFKSIEQDDGVKSITEKFDRKYEKLKKDLEKELLKLERADV